MSGRWGWVAACAALGFAQVAAAHELRCDKSVNGTQLLEISEYPAALSYELVVTNVHPTDPSDVLAAEDSLYSSVPDAQFEAPFLLGLGEAATRRFDVVENTFEHCRDLALRDGGEDDFIDNVLTVTWESGQKQCVARVACLPPDPPAGPTRALGFFENHVEAARACLDAGPVDLGFVTLASVEDALGLWWASPNVFDDGSPRSALEQARFLLARQALVGICNERLFATAPSPPTLITDALAAVCGTEAAAMHSLQALLEAYAGSGDALALPLGLAFGNAEPLLAHSLANDPTAAGQTCAP